MQYLTPKQLVQTGKYPFTMGQIRMFLREKEANGLAKAVRKIGKHLYFRDDLFQEWIDKIWMKEQWK